MDDPTGRLGTPRADPLRRHGDGCSDWVKLGVGAISGRRSLFSRENLDKSDMWRSPGIKSARRVPLLAWSNGSLRAPPASASTRFGTWRRAGRAVRAFDWRQRARSRRRCGITASNSRTTTAREYGSDRRPQEPWCAARGAEVFIPPVQQCGSRAARAGGDAPPLKGSALLASL